MNCPLEKLHPALDRFQEAHFYLHQMEHSYHAADHFRWSLNSFLRALKEVPQLISMGIQNYEGLPKKFSIERDSLKNDPLISYLGTQRDFIVHHGMLLPASHGSIGITEGRGMKLGLSIPIDPSEDSDDIMLSFAYGLLSEKNDFLGFFDDDEDSLPCIEREWKLEQFPDELTDLSAKAWLRMGQSVQNVLSWLGNETLDLSLSCRHNRGNFKIKTFNRAKIKQKVSHVMNERKKK